MPRAPAAPDGAGARRRRHTCGEPVEPIHVSALAARTGIDQNTVSHHLAVLRHGGYVRARKQGKHTYYTAVPSRVRVDRPPGDLSLTVTYPSGSYITYSAPMAEPSQVSEPPRAAEPAGGEVVQE